MTERERRQQVLARHQKRLELWTVRLAEVDHQFFWLRLGSLTGGALATWLAFLAGPAGSGPVVWAAALLLFVAVVYFHRRLDRARGRFTLALARSKAQLARLQIDWAEIPAPTASLPALPADHPFAADLNLVGPRSLHTLLDTAISQGGSARLRDWLLDPLPDPETIHARQEALKELLPLTGFRSRLDLNGGLVSQAPQQRWDGDALVSWLEDQFETDRQVNALRRTLLLLSGLAALNILLFVLNSLGVLPALWIGSFILYAILYFSQYQSRGDLFGQAQDLSVALSRFRSVLLFLERYPYRKGSHLEALTTAFRCGGAWCPSSLLRRLSTVASAASLQHNAFIWVPLNALVPWDLFFTYQLYRYKSELKDRLPQWLDAWYELEALNSLANFTYLNPEYSLPRVLSSAPAASGQPAFRARGMGHPLIPHEQRVCNDLTIEETGEVILITGSNMSGKSTFLRTVGVNLRLAYAGGPVCAGELQTGPYRLFTSLNVSDSLNDGISFFYAEVRRLRALLDQLEAPHPFPVFFMIDEIFRGTNNRERAIGSRSLVAALAGKHSVGIISTHDLELVHLEEQLPGISNYHFREDVEGEKMVFDYRLRPGPSPTTNALRIMELAGLPVPPQTGS